MNDYREPWEKEIKIQIETDFRFYRLVLRLAKATCFLWFPWRERVLFWLKHSAIKLCRFRVNGERWQRL